MRYFTFLSLSLLLFSQTAVATWQKINDADYVWGPFKIYNLALYSETGQYTPETRPLMLTLKYAKPVDGRDFAISLARSWSNLGITLPQQDEVVDRLRKTVPNIKKDDSLSYIALEDKGYFVLNDTILNEEFNQDFNNAVLAIWLDPRVEIGRRLLDIKAPDFPPINTHIEAESPKLDEPPKSEESNDPEIEILPPADPMPEEQAPIS